MLYIFIQRSFNTRVTYLIQDGSAPLSGPTSPVVGAEPEALGCAGLLGYVGKKGCIERLWLGLCTAGASLHRVCGPCAKCGPGHRRNDRHTTSVFIPLLCDGWKKCCWIPLFLFYNTRWINQKLHPLGRNLPVLQQGLRWLVQIKSVQDLTLG